MIVNLPHNKKYLLACSFGPDSMALFHLLLANKYDFEVAHVNYHQRKESDGEEENLRQFCLQNDIILHIKRVFNSDVKGNFQAWARRERYQFFSEVIQKRRLDVLLTAHHRDDVIETYFMQKRAHRESDYYGIKSETQLFHMNVIRPLLSFTKSELLDYCHQQQVPYAIDQSNLHTKYHRNYVRHHILSALSEEEKKSIVDNISQHNQEQSLLNVRLVPLINKQNEVELSTYASLNKSERQRLVFMQYAQVCGEMSFTKGLFNQINQTLMGQKKTAFFRLKQHVYLSLANDKYVLLDIRNFQPYQHIIEKADFHFVSKHIDFDLRGDLSRYHIFSTSFPLKVRTYMKGDTYLIAGYRKKVNRLFIDMKLPKHLRRIWPLILDCEGKIIYIPRYRPDYQRQEKDKLHVLR